jgi:predicted ATPase
MSVLIAMRRALIQDAAYENLLKRRREALHRRVAEALRDTLAATAPAEPEALAHYFLQAGLANCRSSLSRSPYRNDHTELNA